MSVQRTRTQQLRAPLTTLGYPKSTQCNFNSCSFNCWLDYSSLTFNLFFILILFDEIAKPSKCLIFSCIETCEVFSRLIQKRADFVYPSAVSWVTFQCIFSHTSVSNVIKLETCSSSQKYYSLLFISGYLANQ